MPVKNDREYRRIDINNIEARAEDDGQKIVEGYATVFNEYYDLFDDADYRVMEQVDAHAFDGAKMDDVIMQYDHEGRVFARVKNGTLTVTPDEHGLKIRADLGGTEIGRQLYEEIKGGYTDKMSFGFTVAKDELKTVEDKEKNKTTVYRTILKIKRLYDVSAVSLPANDATEISARNLGEGVIAEVEKERLAEMERQRKIKKIKILMEVNAK